MRLKTELTITGIVDCVLGAIGILWAVINHHFIIEMDVKGIYVIIVAISCLLLFNSGLHHLEAS